MQSWLQATIYGAGARFPETDGSLGINKNGLGVISCFEAKEGLF